MRAWRLTLAWCLSLTLLAVMVAGLARAADLRAGFAAGSLLSDPRQPVAVPAELKPEDVDGFVAVLSDEDARRILLETLRKGAESTPPPAEAPTIGGIGSLVHALQMHVERLASRGDEVAEGWSQWPRLGKEMLRNLTDQEGWPAVGRGLLITVVVVGLGSLLEVLIRLGMRPLRRRLHGLVLSSVFGRIGAAGVGLVLELLALAAFAFACSALSLVFFARFDPMRLLVTTTVVVIVLTRGAMIISRVLFAAGTPAKRLLPIADGPARLLERATVALVALGAFGFSVVAMLKILGLSEPLAAVADLAVGTALAAGAMVLIMALARTPPAPLRTEPSAAGDEGSDLARAVSQSWTLFAIAYLVLVWVVWGENTFLGRENQALRAVSSLAIVLAVPLVDWLARRFLDYLAHWRAGAATVSAPDRLQGWMLGALRMVLVATALLLLVEAWHSGFIAWFERPFGQRLASAAFNIVVTLLLAYVVWEFVKAWTERHLGSEDETAAATRDEDEGSGLVVRSRTATLLPLFRTTVLVLLVTTATMIVLSSLGVDIGPLLAGAGVVGIAVGFGAQALVRDIVAGIFFLIDDAFRLGEYIEIDDRIRGEVERISLRSMQLRHHRGPLLTLPFGELRSIINHNRDWVIFKQEFPVAYDTNLELVRKLIKKLGQQLLDDPEHGEKFLEPLKSQGVFKIEGSALVVRTKFKCKPREQFVLRRVVYQRVKEIFAANGIQLWVPTVAVAGGAAVERPGVEGAVSAATAAQLAATPGPVSPGSAAP